MTILRHQRHPSVGDHSHIGDGAILAHERMQPCIFDHERLTDRRNILTERMRKRRLTRLGDFGREAGLAFKKLPVRIDQRDESDRHLQRLGSQRGEQIEKRLGRRIEQIGAAQRREPSLLQDSNRVKLSHEGSSFSAIA